VPHQTGGGVPAHRRVWPDIRLQASLASR